MSEQINSVDFWAEKLIKDTNPDHFDFHEKFIPYMNDKKFSGFGNWMFNNGHNVGLYNLRTKVNTYCVPQWVSVKNRLPEKNGWYLTAHNKTYPTDSGMKVRFFCHGLFMTDKVEVTHWRPLPKYPVEEVEKENNNGY